LRATLFNPYRGRRGVTTHFIFVNAFVAAWNILFACKSGKIFFACPFGIRFTLGFQIVQTLHKNEAGNLLNGC
jgi:hypothetical protein